MVLAMWLVLIVLLKVIFIDTSVPLSLYETNFWCGILIWGLFQWKIGLLLIFMWMYISSALYQKQILQSKDPLRPLHSFEASLPAYLNFNFFICCVFLVIIEYPFFCVLGTFVSFVILKNVIINIRQF